VGGHDILVHQDRFQALAHLFELFRPVSLRQDIVAAAAQLFDFVGFVGHHAFPLFPRVCRYSIITHLAESNGLV
jgi:hypothetical protein